MWYSLEFWKSSDSERNFCRQCFVLFHTKNIFCFVCYCPVVVAIYMCGCCWIFWVVMRIYNILGECFVEWKTYKKKVLCSKFLQKSVIGCVYLLFNEISHFSWLWVIFEEYAYSCQRSQRFWKFLRGKRA